MLSAFVRIACLPMAALLIGAAQPDDVPLSARIIEEGFTHSEVMATAIYLGDRIGGRLTNSPTMRAAELWTQERLRFWGLSNVHAEAYDFGRGWTIEEATAVMITPRRIALRSIPVAWTPGTKGQITADVVLAPIARASDFVAWHGKLTGKIVLLSPPRDPVDETAAPFARRSDADLAGLDTFRQPVSDPAALDRLATAQRFNVDVEAFLKVEGAAGWARQSSHENGLVSGEGFGFRVGHNPTTARGRAGCGGLPADYPPAARRAGITTPGYPRTL